MNYGSRYSVERPSSSSRRDHSPRRHHRHHHHHRSASPPSTERKSRDPSVLPESFGRMQAAEKSADEELNVLQRMKAAYKNSPLDTLNNYIENKVKIRVWTRNRNNIRGMSTGYIKLFDKHWNLVMKDCEEVFYKPKKSKTPFLRNISPNENLPDMPVKVPRKKKTENEKTVSAPEPPKALPKEGKKKKKPSKTTIERRSMSQLFIRGDNIVMLCPDEDYVQVDDVSHDDITQEDISQDDISQEDTSQDDITQEDISQDDISQEDTSQDDFSQENISQDEE